MKNLTKGKIEEHQKFLCNVHLYLETVKLRMCVCVCLGFLTNMFHIILFHSKINSVFSSFDSFESCSHIEINGLVILIRKNMPVVFYT